MRSAPPTAPSQDLVSLFRTLGEPSDELQRGQSIGRFTIEERLGAGGMGVVYAAHDSELRRRVALKLLHPRSGQTADDLLREAQHLARLNHPNVVTVYEANVTHGRVWISMEYVEGCTLAAWHRQRAHSWEEVLAVMLPVGHGLAAAHAAGLAHGDLKPGNIMVGNDGRPRILDFGLARERPAADSTQPTTGDSEPVTAPAERSGSGTQATDLGGGTPAYMAPEQRRQIRADALTDQFSYCVTFWEFLFGQRPFAGSGALSANENALATPQMLIQAGAHVPAWLLDPIKRGLSVDRRLRWPSMAPLLAALARGPIDSQRRRARWRLAGVGFGVLAATLLGLQALSRVAVARKQSKCEAEARVLESAWNDDARAQVRQAVLATGASYAEPVASYVLSFMDRYAADWRDASARICREDRREDGHPDLNAVRAHWCLAERRMMLTALVEEYLQAGTTATRNAAMMTGDLDPPDNCTDPAYLEGHPAPRFDQLRDVQAIKRTLVRANNLLASDKPLRSLATAESVRGRAALTGWRPLMAAVDYAAGKAYESLQQYRRSAFYLEQAFQEAAISNDRVVMAEAAILSISISSNVLTRYSEAERWAWLAEIPLATLEPSGGLRSAFLLHSRAGIHENNGEYRQAANLFRQAVETQEAIVGEDDSQLAIPLNNLGTVLLFAGHLEDSRGVLERAVQIQESAMGPRHPALVPPLIGLGNVHRALGQRESARTFLERALSIIEESHAPPDASLAECLNTLGAVEDDPLKARNLFQRALAIREEILPRNHPDVAKSRNNLAALAFQAGSYLDALKTWQSVAAIQVQTLGTAHPDLALTMLNLSAAQLELGFLADARSSGTRAIEIWRGAGLGELPMIGLVLVNLADISTKAREPVAARDFALAALEHLQRTLGPEHADVAYALVALSEVELAAGRPDTAVDPAARALKLRESTEAPEHDLVAQARFCLARALWDTPPGHGGDRPRARDQAAQALAGYKTVSATRPEIAEIERWQAAHHSD